MPKTLPGASDAPFPGDKPAWWDAVIFDFDGVILDSVPIKTEAFADLFAEYPDHLPAILDLHRRLGGISRYAKFTMIHADILGQPLSDERRAFLGRRFEEIVLRRVLDCPFIPGAREALGSLSGRVPMAVVSGTPQEELRDIVARRRLDDLFLEVLGSPTSKPDHLRGLCARHGWRPDRAVFIGDAVSDFEAAQAVGMPFLGLVPPRELTPFPQGTACRPNLWGLDSHLGLC